jgi:hypothetical protein
MRQRLSIPVILALLAVVTGSCQRDDDVLVSIVNFEVMQPQLTDQGIQLRGRVLTNREISPESYGICYGTGANPDINDFIAPGTDLETTRVQESYEIEFSATIPRLSLSAGTGYYIRAFLTTRTGTAYSQNQVQFVLTQTP